MTTKTVRQFAERGIVVRTAGGTYSLDDSVRRVLAHYRDIASDKGGAVSLAAIREQRIRLAKASADHQEIKNAVARGELVPAVDVESKLGGVLRTVRAGMLAVPSRAAQRLPHQSPHDVGVIDGEVRDVRSNADCGGQPGAARSHLISMKNGRDKVEMLGPSGSVSNLTSTFGIDCSTIMAMS